MDALVRAVAEQGYTEPTPIQSQAIPPILAGRDLLGAAQTGTGKTAGFTLPMLQRLATMVPPDEIPVEDRQPGYKPPVRALIITPTRELAAQVQESVRTYGKHVMALRSATIFGGVNINPQIAELKRGVEILVATPGRLLDHVQQRTVDLSHVEILVLDEADRMLDMGFIHDMRRIVALLPRERQTLLFSATFSEEIRKLASAFLRDPVTVEVARRNTPAELVSQVAHPVDRERKRELLAHLVKSNNWQQVLVFTKTKHGANRLAQQLERDGIDADAIHGNKSQPARTRALKRFKAGELQVLVATDIAARGLDIEALPHVVNFDLPNVPEDYVHRIGRTGRAGESGDAVSLVSAEDRPLMVAIERLMNRKVEQKVVAGFEPGSAPLRPANDAPEHRPARGAGRHESRGNVRAESADAPRTDLDDEDHDGPAPGNELHPRAPRAGQPQQRAPGAPGGKRNSRQRRRGRGAAQPGNAPRHLGHPQRGPASPSALHPQYLPPHAPHDDVEVRDPEVQPIDPRLPVLPVQRDIDEVDGNRMPEPGNRAQPGHERGAPRPAGNRPGKRRRGRGAAGGQPGQPGQRTGGNGARAGRPGGARGARPQPAGKRRGPGGPGMQRPKRPLDPMEEERLRQLAEGKRLARGDAKETPAERKEREAAANRKAVKRSPIPTVISYLKRKISLG